jgi:sulfate adenylyltransferase (ADP) / ATP adenylyltransferase
MNDFLEPGTLWAKLTGRVRSATQCGALRPVPTESTLVEQEGIRFVVRVLAGVARQHAALPPPERDFDPFLPYDPELFVADLSPTHLALLNKFNVVDCHLLIVTRAFEEQESPLTLADFAALGTCLAEFPALAFYNAGPSAGASQRHKHLQLVPLPLGPGGPPVPVESALAAACFQDAVGRAPALPFAHAVVRLEGTSAGHLLDGHRSLQRCLGLRPGDPYNLLATREWMLLVPRWRGDFSGISVNALGFAGALLVRDERQLQQVKEWGPLEMLRGVAAPARRS